MSASAEAKILCRRQARLCVSRMTAGLRHYLNLGVLLSAEAKVFIERQACHAGWRSTPGLASPLDCERFCQQEQRCSVHAAMGDSC